MSFCAGTNAVGDTIIEYAWDLDAGDGVQYRDAFGAVVDVTAYYTNKGPGIYTVNLRVKTGHPNRILATVRMI